MQEQPKQQEQRESTESRPAARWRYFLQRAWRRIENIAFGVVATLIFLYFVLQSPAFQNWLVGKITTYLSEELETTVSIQHVDISFFDNLVLEGLFIADQRGDTLLYAERFKAGLNSNIFSLFRDRLEFNEISLTRARINIRRLVGDDNNNLQFLLDYFSSAEPKPDKKARAVSDQSTEPAPDGGTISFRGQGIGQTYAGWRCQWSCTHQQF
ncbi:MAG: hypothetical protein IPM98_10930 [Lewinellaceae bacterium]|nr:hypothetical protein [Lewinellaceae bacterium]